MRILADFHHEHLYESLRILFEDRFGWELFRPIGEEWYNEGYWKVYDHPSTVQQYLSLNSGRKYQDVNEDGRQVNGEEHRRYQNWNPTMIQEGVYQVETPSFPGKIYKAITLEAFKENDFDIILASMPEHQGCYINLRNNFKPNAKLIFQVGNNWPLGLLAGYPNILTSAKTLVPQCEAANVHHCYYRQEFDTELFAECEPDDVNTAANLMHYMQEVPLLHAVEAAMPDWTFKWHGAGNRDGLVGPAIEDIAKTFQEFAFIFHHKREGDGYGFNIHHGMSRGRPMICNVNDFRGQTAEDLLDDSTCVNIANKSAPEIADMLVRAAAEYPELQQRVITRFNSVVNFDNEVETVVRPFMENLV